MELAHVPEPSVYLAIGYLASFPASTYQAQVHTSGTVPSVCVNVHALVPTGHLHLPKGTERLPNWDGFPWDGGREACSFKQQSFRSGKAGGRQVQYLTYFPWLKESQKGKRCLHPLVIPPIRPFPPCASPPLEIPVQSRNSGAAFSTARTFG